MCAFPPVPDDGIDDTAPQRRADCSELRTAWAAMDMILRHITELDQAGTVEELDRILPDLLASLGRYAKSARAYLFDWADPSHTAFRMTHEWCAEGVMPTYDMMQDVRIADMPNWMPRFRRGEPIVSPDWEAERTVTPEEYALFDGQDIHSLIVLPTFTGQEVSGYIGLDDPDQTSAAMSLRLLSSLGGHLGSLKANLRMMSALEEKQRRLQDSMVELAAALTEARLNSEIVSSISKIYWLIYRMDLTADTYEEISAGREMHRLTGRHGRTDAMLRDALDTIVSPEHRDAMRAFLDPSTLSRRLAETESVATEYRAVNGSWHLARFIVKKRAADGAVTHVLYVVRQIDKQKQIEIEYQQKLLKAAEEARRADLAKTDFLRRMSHDIRTPINGIRGMAAIAVHALDDPAKQRECWGKVMDASGFLLDLVNSVLDMNKLESGAVTLEHGPFDLPALLRQTRSIIEAQGREQAVSLVIGRVDIRHPRLIGSPLHLRQILQNITGNGIKYNRPGGTVTVSCVEGPDDGETAWFDLTCADTGRGMSAEFLPHAFEPFSQEGTDARTAYTGTGLGLSIVKQLVELMGGSIQVESELGQGTRFTLRLPFQIDHWTKTSLPAAEDGPEPSLRGVRVLLAEDNELNMEIAQFLLERAGMDVTRAWNGQEAVERFAEAAPGTFDVILMDIMMPVMDGLEAAHAIRGLDRPDAKTVPIFAMTANAFQDDIEQSRAAGMDEHLSKPLDEQAVLAAIRCHIRPRDPAPHHPHPRDTDEEHLRE